MMPYAAENTVSQDPIADGIEISQSQYKEALAAQLGGQAITVASGSLLILSSTMKSVYLIGDKSEIRIPENTPTQDGYSDIKPGEFDEWVDGAWVVDVVLQKESQRNVLKALREQALNAIQHTIADGSIYQVRPSDLPNFSMAIQEGQPEYWVLDNNVTRLTTVAEMQECIMAGIAQGKVIWRSHTDALKALNEQAGGL
jgi:hypothetical protein